MQIPLSKIKILKTEFENQLKTEELISLLLSGRLYEFEQILHQLLIDLYNKISEELIKWISLTPTFVTAQKNKASEKGLKKLDFRKAQIQLRTGKKINYDSLYAKSAPTDYEGSRHLSLLIFQSEESTSPMYKSLSCLHSVLCPSFQVAKELMNYQGIKVNFDRVRQNSLALADAGMKKRSSVQLEQGESLSGKRVVIAMDGGRTRTRVYEENKRGRGEKFDTPWREPKLFVISTIDENGKINKETKPIYDGSFGDDETFDLLKQYLENLEIEKAESVQFLGDGAPWIWNRARPMLCQLGVKEENIIETLDYYHAAEHLHDMKAYFDKDKQGSYFDKVKDALWRGNFSEMTQLIQKGITGVNLAEFNPFKYFKKQQNRIDYQALRSQNRPCGSGIIESGIRRIINLRFKSPSTFWFPENVEKLIFMRAAALSGRWNIMMYNLFCRQ
jgi:hypothetical protein